MKKSKVTCLSLLLPLITTSCSISLIPNKEEKEDDDVVERQTKEQVEVFENNYGNKRSYNKKFFANPANYYRPLVVNNRGIGEDYGLNPSVFDEYYKMGYGGAVTNYNYGENYLSAQTGWDNLNETISYGIDKLGMRVMLYDEEYYPSGKARNLTLKDSPKEYEAQGLYITSQHLSSGNTINVPSVPGFQIHKIVFYPGINNIANVNNSNYEIKEAGQQVNSDGLVCFFFHKYWYEGTHFANNLMEGCRYIDLMNPDPVSKFIDNTYNAYYNHFSKYFGNGIESFFFDEPSLPGGYFVPDQNTRYVDPIDKSIVESYYENGEKITTGFHYYPTLNYDLRIIEAFKELYGYDPTPFMPLLMLKVNENNETAMRFRWQYYRLIGHLVSNSFANNLASWCNSKNVFSTGHFLCEETIALHPLLLGDYAECYHNMGTPGIDLTNGQVNVPIDIACVAKLASGVAEFDNKQDVFCEIGKDEDDGIETSIDENIANVAIMQSYDVNYLASYYKTYQLSDEDNEKLANVLGRINYMMAGNANEKEVAVYYPIEGVMVNTTPYDKSGDRILVNDFYFTDQATLGNTYRDLCASLVRNHIDYSVVSSYMFTGDNQFTFDNENHRMINPKTGQSYKKIVIPYTVCLEENTLRALKKAKDAGVAIIFEGLPSSLSLQFNKDKTDELNNIYSEVYSYATKTGVDSQQVINQLGDCLTVGFLDGNKNFVCAKQYNGNYRSATYMLVNTSNVPQSTTLVCNERGSNYLDWDVYTGEVGGMVVSKKGSLSYIDVNVPPYGVKIFTID